MRRLVIVGLVLAGHVACGPPSFIESREQIDDYLSRGNYEYACVGLQMTDEYVRGYAAQRLAKYKSSPETGVCLCEAVYDAEAGTWDEVVVKALQSTRRDDAAACLVPALDDARIEDRPALATALGAMLAPAGMKGLADRAGAGAPEVRVAAIGALQASPEHGKQLMTWAKDPDATVRAAAVRALSGRKDTGIRGLLIDRAKNDEHGGVRASAVELLGKLKRSDADDAICDRLMNDEDAGVRRTAALAFKGTNSERNGKCMRKRLVTKEPDEQVRNALLESMQASPADAISDALCDEIGPFLRMYVHNQFAPKMEGVWIVEAQNNRHWERSYDCVRKALSQGGYSCYARNHLAHWMIDLGGKATPPECE